MREASLSEGAAQREGFPEDGLESLECSGNVSNETFRSCGAVLQGLFGAVPESGENTCAGTTYLPGGSLVSSLAHLHTALRAFPSTRPDAFDPSRWDISGRAMKDLP